MPDMNLDPTDTAPAQTLHLALHRQGQAWTADLAAQPGTAPQRFDSLQDLVGYLTRLDPAPAGKGLR